MKIDMLIAGLPGSGQTNADGGALAGNALPDGASFKNALAQAAEDAAVPHHDAEGVASQRTAWNQVMELALAGSFQALAPQAVSGREVAPQPLPESGEPADEELAVLPEAAAFAAVSAARDDAPSSSAQAPLADRGRAAVEPQYSLPGTSGPTVPNAPRIRDAAAIPAPEGALKLSQTVASGTAPADEAAVKLAAAVRADSEASAPRPTAPEVAAAASAASTSPASGSAGSGAAAPSQTLGAPLGTAQWQQDFGQQVATVVRRGDRLISMNLNAPELGPLLVDVRVSEQSAQLQLSSQHAAVRSAVEQAIPQLRDALAEQGITLGEATVGDQRSPWGGKESGQPGEHPHGTELAGAAADDGEPEPVPVVDLNGRVDLYV